MQFNCNSKNGSDVSNFRSNRWSTDGSTSSEPIGLHVTSMIKTLTDYSTLDDRNHQGHHTTLLQSETLLSTSQRSLCVNEIKSLETTGVPWREFWSQIPTCILTCYRLNKSLHLMTWRSEWSCVSAVLRQDWRCNQTSFTMFGFRTRHMLCCKVTLTLGISFSGIAHPLTTACKGHYTLSSVKPGSPYPRMASCGRGRWFEDFNHCWNHWRAWRPLSVD